MYRENYANESADTFNELYCLHQRIRELEKELEAAKTDTKWISVNERMPDSSELCLLACKSTCYNGKTYRYVCDGFYAERWKEEEANDGSGDQAIEYNEDDDEYYLCEGWYERIHNWDDYNSIVISDTVTHWMPLPEPLEEVEG